MTGDVRKHPCYVIYVLRPRAVQLKDNGYTHAEAAEALDTSVAAVRRWWGLYKEGGMDATRPKQSGRRHGGGGSLTLRQEKAICETLEEGRPEKVKMAFAPLVAFYIKLRVSKCAIRR